jgi:glycosyltransferase involved in cell wall biosynthesis
VSAVICTLNEAENLRHVLPFIPSSVDEVVLIDGHSTDATVDVARRLRPDIVVHQQPGKGKDVAMQYGVQKATGDIVVMLDADGETDPAEMDKFLAPLLQGYDLAKGTRFAHGYKNKPFKRVFGNWTIAMTCNVLFFKRYSDLCSGYTAFWKDAAEDAGLWKANGWLYEPRIIARALRNGLRVIEVEHRSLGRISGQSRLPNWRQGLNSIRYILIERLRPPRSRKKKRAPILGRS